MPRFGSGLIITPSLGAAQVSSVSMTFEPSIGIMARKVDKLGANIRSFREPLRESVRDVVIPSIQMNFAKSGRPRWPELAESTWAQKTLGEKALIRTGALRDTMKQIGIWHIDTEKAMITNLPSRVWYGVVQQAGLGGTSTTFVRNIGTGGMTAITEEGEGGIPARPFVMLQESDMPKIDMIFVRWVNKRVRQAGLS